MDYDKQPINVDEQVALLQNRGLVIEERVCVIGKLENECVKAFLDHEEEILAGTFEGALIDHISEHERNAYITCTQVSRKKIYASKPVLDIELSGYKIMATLMEVFIDAAVNPSRFYSKQLLRRVSSQYDTENESLEERIKDVETLWKTTQVFSGYQKYCKVEGVSKEDSLVIASDAIASKPYEAVKFKSRGDVFTVSRIQFLAGGKVLVDGYYTTTYNEDHSILYFDVGDGKGGTLENFYLKPKEGSLFFWDLTDKYKEAYPQVTKVELVWAAAQHF